MKVSSRPIDALNEKAASKYEVPIDGERKVAINDGGVTFEVDGVKEKFINCGIVTAVRYLRDRGELAVIATATDFVYDPARQELLTTHSDGVVRRWRLPSEGRGRTQ